MKYKKFMDKQDDKMTLGDIMKDKLKDIQLPKKKDKKDKKEEKND